MFERFKNLFTRYRFSVIVSSKILAKPTANMLLVPLLLNLFLSPNLAHILYDTKNLCFQNGKFYAMKKSTNDQPSNDDPNKLSFDRRQGCPLQALSKMGHIRPNYNMQGNRYSKNSWANRFLQMKKKASSLRASKTQMQKRGAFSGFGKNFLDAFNKILGFTTVENDHDIGTLPAAGGFYKDHNGAMRSDHDLGKWGPEAMYRAGDEHFSDLPTSGLLPVVEEGW